MDKSNKPTVAAKSASELFKPMKLAVNQFNESSIKAASVMKKCVDAFNELKNINPKRLKNE